ncbi:hypothetical protein LTR15_012799 [Elasticomyces elasticus]|nr:hypothetical protein LTR15_012799 [Elasticomyces elasticus]
METSGLTMTWNPTELQRRAETFAPLAIEDLNTHLSKASRMVLAILRHNITEEIWQAEPQNAFVWVKGRDKVTVDEVRNASRLAVRPQDCQFSPPGYMKMSQLGKGPANRILVFVAVDLNPRPAASITPKRQPLQPVKRQLSTPLRHSQDEARLLKTDHERRNTPIRERLQAARQSTGTPKRYNGDVKREHADTQPPMGSVAAAQALLDGQLHGNADADDDYKPRTQDEPFPASQEQEDEKPQKRGAQIQALLKETSPERLEAAVTAGAKILDELRLPLLNLPGNNDAVSWLEQIGKQIMAATIKCVRNPSQDKNGNKITNPKREFEFWPLIKVVKILTKAEALSTGAVIVDLPGVHDSNAARAAVAESYMKQCTGLWIVAPINRAVDDKAAKSLLGNTFKRQLKYDGTYSAVTFICSKTDDISRTEVSESLGLEEYRELEERQDEIDRKKRALNKELNELKNKKDDHEDAIEQVENDMEAWEDLEGSVEEGKTVYAPSSKSLKKRKSDDEKPAASRKRRKISADSDDESQDVGGAAPAEESQRQPLTSEDISEKLADLKQLKKEARRERTSIDSEITALKGKLKPIEAEEKEIDAKMSAICIRGRNEYSRDAIRQDFADGIRELDQENAEEEDPDAFDPTEDIRDYEQVARDLPVFCVSSRAYQKLEGRFKKDKDVPGFESKEQTEIPQLQVHCKKLTENGRQAGCRRFLNSLTQVLTSLGLWSSDDGSGKNNLNRKQRDMERDYLNKRLKELERALEKAVAETLEDVEQTLNDQIFDKFAPAIDAASESAGPTSAKWGAHKNDGGLYWGSYKATVKRDGVFSSAAAGARDFNGDLTEPLYMQLAST